MNIHEYQAKALLRSYGAPVSDGRVVLKAEDAKAAAGEMDGPMWVIKAQIHAGGRGKGGGVKFSPDRASALERIQQILGMTLVTHQSEIFIVDGNSHFLLLIQRADKLTGRNNRTKEKD